jgi:hypothetical protein
MLKAALRRAERHLGNAFGGGFCPGVEGFLQVGQIVESST